jgi:hypothetical protein
MMIPMTWLGPSPIEDVIQEIKYKITLQDRDSKGKYQKIERKGVLFEPKAKFCIPIQFQHVVVSKKSVEKKSELIWHLTCRDSQDQEHSVEIVGGTSQFRTRS